ncbi:unnamed protein product [Brachionus calyciflorus]|uniref:Protein FAM136A n=1 Tax=Brachionus calyciflorus TaxID=104777 RepID=A0A813YS66_9BILA|nr:unnamed protein product [Brachionus calyciflorus]
MEEFAHKIQEEIGQFDREYLRKIQGDMFRCSATCCDNTSTSQNDLQRCLETCAQPAMKADRFMQEQMQDMQDRFQRCAMSCADKIKDKSTFGEVNQQANRAEMEKCVTVCGDEMIKMLPNYTNKMRDWFRKGYYLQ